MHFTGLDYVLWAASDLGTAALGLILIFRRRWRDFPFFTAFQLFCVAVFVPLYVVSQDSSRLRYEQVYYPYDILSTVLWLGMVWDMERIVLRPTGTWVRDARRQLLLWGAAGILLAAVIPWQIVRPDPDLLRVWSMRSDIFVDTLLTELVTLLLLTAQRLGLGWRHHVMALTLGAGVSGAVDLIITALQSYFGTHRYYSVLDQIGQAVYLAVLTYWIVQFWREEPARQPLSPQFAAYIQALHERVESNLDIFKEQG